MLPHAVYIDIALFILWTIGRNGVEVKPSAISDAVGNPVKVVTEIDNLGKISTQFRGNQSTVVLNEMGKVVSCWAKSSKYWRI